MVSALHLIRAGYPADREYRRAVDTIIDVIAKRKFIKNIFIIGKTF
jgi:hypothetical protein